MCRYGAPWKPGGILRDPTHLQNRPKSGAGRTYPAFRLSFSGSLPRSSFVLRLLPAAYTVKCSKVLPLQYSNHTIGHLDVGLRA